MDNPLNSQSAKWALVSVVVVLLVAFFSALRSPKEGPMGYNAKTLVQRSVDATALAEQDANPVQALEHAMQAQAFLDAALSLETADRLNQLCKTRVDELAMTIRTLRAQKEQLIAAVCPVVQPFLTSPGSLLSSSI